MKNGDNWDNNAFVVCSMGSNKAMYKNMPLVITLYVYLRDHYTCLINAVEQRFHVSEKITQRSKGRAGATSRPRLLAPPRHTQCSRLS